MARKQCKSDTIKHEQWSPLKQMEHRILSLKNGKLENDLLETTKGDRFVISNNK